MTIVYENFLKNSLTQPKQIIHLCSNSEFFSLQKIQLLVSCFLSESNHNKDARNLIKQCSFKYLCIGLVKSLFDIGSDQSVMSHYNNRQKYFSFASNQRKIISDQLNEANIKALTKFSIVFDMLITNHVNDINKFNKVDMNEIETNNNLKEFEQSSFILYCCARLSTILEKFESMIQEGIYAPTNFDNLDFHALLKHDLEKKLSQEYLFKFEDYLNEIQNAICKNDCEIGIKLDKVNYNKLLKMLVDMSNLFSKYYSKIHILEVGLFKLLKF